MFTNELKFSDLTKMLEAMSSASDTKKRYKFVSEYFSKLHSFQKEFKKKGNKDSSMLPVMRLILAQEEKERAYNLQEKSFRQLFLKVLQIRNGSVDGIKIIQCSENLLPDAVFDIMKSRATKDSNLSVYKVDEALTLLSEDYQKSAQETQLTFLIQNSNALDLKWLVKMILKKRMDIGISIPRVLDLLHPLASKLFKKYLHLSRVVELIESGQAETSLVDVCEVFVPLRAMLSQKFNAELKKENLNFSEMFAETKMDGERFQLHMKDNKFRFFSRNLFEFSEGFNELISPLIKFKTVVHSIILDGEMMVYDKTNQQYQTKGETNIDVKHMKGGKYSSQFRPCFCAFDLLFLNDRSYINDPYSKRHQVLGQLFDNREGVFVKTKPVMVRDADHIADLFNQACENEEEGIVLKKAESIYAPGERNEGWYKVKADYFDGDIVQDFDCVIIGGFYKNPYKKDFFTRYMVGVVEKQTDGNFDVFACGEVVSGIKVQERMKLQDTLKPNLVEFAGESEIPFGKGRIVFGKRKPDAWITPDKSIVLECRLNELRKSSGQYTKYTFRFPRIINIRKDKIWDESCTLKEFQDFCERDDGKVQKVVKRDVKTADIISPSRKRKAATSKAAIAEKFCRNSQESEEVEIVDIVLEGKEFCVMTTGPQLPSIKSMKTMIKKHGGTCVEYPRNGKTFALIVSQISNFVRTFMNKKIFNVIKAEWLVQNFGNDQIYKEMPMIRPVFDLIFTTDALKIVLQNDFDEFGDSFTNQFENDEEFKTLLDSMKAPKESDLMEIDHEIGRLGVKSTNFFCNISANFISVDSGNFLMSSAENVFKFYGGKTGEFADFVIVDKKSDIGKIRNKLKLLSVRNSQLVDFHWILDSSDSGYKLNFEDYLVELN